jgi:LPXTG-motif cell wall-anchored protein
MKNEKVWVAGLVVVAMLAVNFATVAAMNVTVQVVSSGQTLDLDVEPTDTILGVKGKIHDATGGDPADMVLVFDEEVLDDTRTLADYSVQKESVLLLTMADTPSDDPQTGDSVPWLPVVAAVAALVVLVGLGLAKKK